MDNIFGGRCSVSLITQLRRCIFSKNVNIFRHLKLDIALAIPASNDEKYNSKNSAGQGLISTIFHQRLVTYLFLDRVTFYINGHFSYISHANEDVTNFRFAIFDLYILLLCNIYSLCGENKPNIYTCYIYTYLNSMIFPQFRS